MCKRVHAPFLQCNPVRSVGLASSHGTSHGKRRFVHPWTADMETTSQRKPAPPCTKTKMTTALRRRLRSIVADDGFDPDTRFEAAARLAEVTRLRPPRPCVASWPMTGSTPISAPKQRQDWLKSAVDCTHQRLISPGALGDDPEPQRRKDLCVDQRMLHRFEIVPGQHPGEIGTRDFK
jgi:hypothetical protein